MLETKRNKKRDKIKGLLFFLFLLFLSISLYAGVEVPICTNPYYQVEPCIWGDKIVWQDDRNGNYDIYMYDLTSGQEIPICTEPNNQRYPAIYEDKIVWMDDRNGKPDIYMYDLTLGREIPICTEPHHQYRPSIYGDKIVWEDWRNGIDIYMYDLSSQREIPICTASRDQKWPAIYGDKIVWMDNRNGNYDIYMYDLTLGREIPICTEPHEQYYPAIYGDKIVWEDNRNGNVDIYMYDLTLGREIPICTQPKDQTSPSIYGDKIVWEDWRNGNPDIYGYDIALGREFLVCTERHDQFSPAIHGQKIVWRDSRNGSYDIYMYLLAFPSSFQKSVDKTSALINEPLTYTISLKNEDLEILENITITDAIPPDTEYVQGSASNNPTYDAQNRKLIWSIPSLNSGSELSLSFRVKPTKEGTVYNEAMFTYYGMSQTSNKVSTVIKVPKLSITKAVDKQSAQKGEQLTYTITVKNEENSTFQNISIEDVIPQNSEYVSGSATGAPTYDASRRTLSWGIASLDAGSQRQLSFKVKVLGGEKVSNKATLTFLGYPFNSEEVSTTVIIPTSDVVEDVNFSLDAGLFAGVYGEIGVGITNFGLKGGELCIGAVYGQGLDFTISNSGSTYSLRVGPRKSTGARIEGGLGKIDVGILSLTTLQEGITLSALKGFNYLFPTPLNDATQSANALVVPLSYASTFGFSMMPGVGSFVEALQNYFPPAGQYLESTTDGAEYEGKTGVLSVAIGTGEDAPKGEISNDVLDAYISGKVERLTRQHPTDWTFQDSLEIAEGGSIGVPFNYGKIGQASFLIGYRANDVHNPSSYFYGTTVDEGINLPFSQLHTIDSYQVECASDLFERAAHEIENNIVGAFISGDYTALQPQRLINDALNFENLLAGDASEGEAVYTRGIEEASQVGLDFGIDIGVSLGVGGGIKIGLSGQILTSNSYPTEQGELINRSRVATQKFNRVQSTYRGAVGIANFFSQMINRTLSESNFVNTLKNFFKTVIQEIQQGIENTTEWVEGGVEWVVNGITNFFGAQRGTSHAELVGYELKSPLLSSTSRGYSISFVPYRSPKVVMLSRQPVSEFTGMKYAVNLNVRKSDGSYVSSFPANSNTLRITIDDDQLIERGFSPSTDWELLNIFWFDPNENTWFQLETTRTRQSNSTLLEAKPQKPGTYAGGIAQLPPDREAPHIDIVSPQNQAKTSPTPIFSATVSDPNLKESSVKFYLDGKEVQPVYRYIGPSANQFLALPPQPLTQGSHTLKVSAEDDSKNKNEVSSTFSVLPPQPKHTISFLSFPFFQTAPLSSLMEFEKSAVWTGTNYDFTNNPQLKAFQGFWVKTPQEFDPSNVHPIGYALKGDQETSLALNKGWNAIGLPWNYQLPLSLLRVEKNGLVLPFSQANNLIGLILYRWDGTGYKSVGTVQGMEDTLYPWYGYWVRAKDDCNLVFPKEPWKNIKEERSSSKDGFSIPIKAVFPDGTIEEVYWGIGKEDINSPFPPPAPYEKTQRRLALLRNGELLFIDIRKVNGKEQWSIWVKGDATLLFPNLSYLPKGWQVILRDGDKRYYLRTTSALKVEGEKELKLEVGKGLITPLIVGMLDARADRGGINIVWNVNLDCTIKLVVKGMDGRLVRDFATRTSTSGMNSLFWEGKSQDGKALSAGIYIIELTARDDSNQMVKAIKGVILR